MDQFTQTEIYALLIGAGGTAVLAVAGVLLTKLRAYVKSTPSKVDDMLFEFAEDVMEDVERQRHPK